MAAPSREGADKKMGAAQPGARTAATFVVIPAFEEERNVRRVVLGIRESVPDLRVIVVDDGSRDATAVEAERAGAEVLKLPFNCGYGVALQTGLMRAKHCGAEFVVTMDADGQHDPRDIATILKPVTSGSADIALGSRYLPESRCYQVPRIRRWASRCISRVVSLLMGQVVHDTTTGFQAINGKALRSYLAMKDFPEKSPDADLLLHARLGGCRIAEIAVTMHASPSGKSMHGFFKSFFYIPQMLAALLGVLLAYRSFRK